MSAKAENPPGIKTHSNELQRMLHQVSKNSDSIMHTLVHHQFCTLFKNNIFSYHTIHGNTAVALYLQVYVTILV